MNLNKDAANRYSPAEIVKTVWKGDVEVFHLIDPLYETQHHYWQTNIGCYRNIIMIGLYPYKICIKLTPKRIKL